jgi:hypothetical protein
MTDCSEEDGARVGAELAGTAEADGRRRPRSRSARRRCWACRVLPDAAGLVVVAPRTDPPTLTVGPDGLIGQDRVDGTWRTVAVGAHRGARGRRAMPRRTSVDSAPSSSTTAPSWSHGLADSLPANASRSSAARWSSIAASTHRGRPRRPRREGGTGRGGGGARRAARRGRRRDRRRRLPRPSRATLLRVCSAAWWSGPRSTRSPVSRPVRRADLRRPGAPRRPRAASGMLIDRPRARPPTLSAP